MQKILSSRRKMAPTLALHFLTLVLFFFTNDQGISAARDLKTEREDEKQPNYIYKVDKTEEVKQPNYFYTAEETKQPNYFYKTDKTVEVKQPNYFYKTEKAKQPNYFYKDDKTEEVKQPDYFYMAEETKQLNYFYKTDKTEVVKQPNYFYKSEEAKQPNYFYKADKTDEVKQPNYFYMAEKTKQPNYFYKTDKTKEVKPPNYFYKIEETKQPNYFYKADKTEEVKQPNYFYKVEKTKQLNYFYKTDKTEEVKQPNYFYKTQKIKQSNYFYKTDKTEKIKQPNYFYKIEKTKQLIYKAEETEKSLASTKQKDLKVSPSHNNDHSEAFEIGFINLDDLYIGNAMTLKFPIQEVSHFLSKRQADSIPLSMSQLPSVLQHFSIPEDSPQVKSMRETLEQCEGKTVKGETNFCATSLESMHEFVDTIIGSETKHDVLTTSQPSPSAIPLQKYTILEISHDIYAPKWVSCHPLQYPYAIYYCHHMATGTRVFKVSLVGDKNGDKMEALGMCHLDTSDWDPEHMIFKTLRIKPGKNSPVCHFFSINHLLWVPVQPSKSTM